MNKYTICFTEIKNGKRHTHCEEFKGNTKQDVFDIILSKYNGVEIMSIELSL
jgi:hypothetical protein